MERISEKHSFDNGRGNTLAAILDRPQDAPRLTAVFGPCFTCVKESHAASKIARALAERGIAVLRIDTTGFGESSGDPLTTNLSSRIADLAAAARYLGDIIAPPRLLIGHSMSGTAALSAWREIPSAEMIVTIGSPRDSEQTIARFTRDGLLAPDPQDDSRVVINVLGRMTVFDQSFVADMMAGTGAADTAAFTGTILAAHAKSDDIVEYEEAEAIVARAKNARHAEVLTLPDTAGHLFLKGAADAEFLAEKITTLI